MLQLLGHPLPRPICPKRAFSQERSPASPPGSATSVPAQGPHPALLPPDPSLQHAEVAQGQAESCRFELLEAHRGCTQHPQPVPSTRLCLHPHHRQPGSPQRWQGHCRRERKHRRRRLPWLCLLSCSNSFLCSVQAARRHRPSPCWGRGAAATQPGRCRRSRASCTRRSWSCRRRPCSCRRRRSCWRRRSSSWKSSNSAGSWAREGAAGSGAARGSCPHGGNGDGDGDRDKLLARRWAP